MKAPQFTLTNNTISLIWEGTPYLVQKGAPNFKGLLNALIDEDWDSVPNHLTVAKSVSEWVKSNVDFAVIDDQIHYKGDPVPATLSKRIVGMAAEGLDPTPLFRFYEKLQLNPSMRSVEQLWPFLEHKGIPLTPEGNFLAYKGVNQDLTDCYTGKYDNSPGEVHEMLRNQISDDPREPCHFGFHVGALSYASSFGPRVVICEVDPADVVCIPYDENARKMRVCKYKVVGHHNGQHLDSFVHSEPEDDRFSDIDDDFFYNDVCGDESFEFDSDEQLRIDNEFVPSDRKAELFERSERAERGEGLMDFDEAVSSVDWASFDDLDAQELMLQCTIDDLRKYASKHLKITGAHNIRGGKVALIAAIVKVRGK